MAASVRSGMALVGALLSANVLLGAEVFVGGSQGAVFRGDSTTGGFQFFGTCGGPISSMAVLGGDLFLGTQNGVIYRLGTASGLVETSFSVPNDAAAMATHDGDLLIGGSDRTVLRVDPADGSVLATYTTVDPVAAMVVVHDVIYVSGSFSAIYRANASDGVFSYFTCSCFGAVNGLAATENDLFLVDAFNSMWRIDLTTGFPMNAFWLEQAGEALLLDDEGRALVGTAQGTVNTHDTTDGAVLGSVPTSIQVLAMAAADAGCPQDINQDGLVDLIDVAMLLSHFNVDDGGDLNGDGQTGLADLSILLSHYGEGCDQ
jgi:outer membrane protein assembly factor BamB